MANLLACNKTFICDEETLPNGEGRAVVYYLAGNNSLSGYIYSNFIYLQNGFLPRNILAHENAVFVVIKLNPTSHSQYSDRAYILKIRRNYNDKVKIDTLYTSQENESIASTKFLEKSLNFIRGKYNYRSYGLVLGSHGTSWLPPKYDKTYPHIERSSGGTPRLTSIAREHEAKHKAIEMDVKDFAKAIPFKLDYIVFDACFLSSIEVAYELKDKVDYILAYPTEILAAGADYNKINERLCKGKEADLKGLAEDTYNLYAKQSGNHRSVTVALAYTKEMDNLAQVYKSLFAKYRSQIATINISKVQRYYQNDSRSAFAWFYDAIHILKVAGASEDELKRAQVAMDKVIVYKNATDHFLSIPIATENFSGFSMYLPRSKDVDLNNYYKTLAWNRATGYIK